MQRLYVRWIMGLVFGLSNHLFLKGLSGRNMLTLLYILWTPESLSFPESREGLSLPLSGGI